MNQWLVAVAIVFGGMIVEAREYRLPKLKVVGAMKTPVVFQGTQVHTKVVKSGVWASVKLVTRWGVHRYQVGKAYFHCGGIGDCEFVDFSPAQTFDHCEVKAQRVRCTGLLSGDTSAPGAERDYGREDGIDLDPSDLGHRDEVEFPGRAEDEYGDIHF